MSNWIQVTNVDIKCPNPAPLQTDFAFEISFLCLEDLSLPLVWRLIYVGCADDKSKDQELESVELGPLKKGSLKFTFEADAPDFNLIDPDDIWGSTVILLEASYRDQDFIRIGWYVHNVYTDPQMQDDPPDIPQMDKLARYIVADEPRVTRFNINWTGEQAPPITIPGQWPPPANMNNWPPSCTKSAEEMQANCFHGGNAWHEVPTDMS